MRQAFSLCALLHIALSTSVVGAETLRGRVVDAQTKAPLPCRLYVQASDGSWRFATSTDAAGSALKYSVDRGPKSFEKHVTLSAHGFAVDVPPGETTLTVELGKEYQPLVRKVTVAAGAAPLEV